MSSDQIQQLREKAQAIVHRAQNDAAFSERLKTDPESTLRAEGLPDEAIGDFAREAQLGEVGGYARADCTFTCLITSCGVTSRSNTSGNCW